MLLTYDSPLHRKYLRDAEREQLAGHAFNMGLQCARATFRRLFKAQSPVSGTRRLYFLLGLYETHAEARPRRRPKIARLLEDTYKLFRGGKVRWRTRVGVKLISGAD